MTLGYSCPLWSDLAQCCTQNFILFLFVIQRQHRFCGNPPYVQSFCLFTGSTSNAERKTTNILARQQHKNEHSITAPPNNLICNKSIQWYLTVYSCIISWYRSMQTAWKISGRTPHMCYSHLITPTVTPDNYKFCRFSKYGGWFSLLLAHFFHDSTALVGINLPTDEVSRSHSNTLHSIGLLWKGDQPDAETSTWQHTTLTRNRHPSPSGIRTRNLSN